jgi:FkbM family methyltransferase
MRDLTRPNMLSAVQETLRRQALQTALAAATAPRSAASPPHLPPHLPLAAPPDAVIEAANTPAPSAPPVAVQPAAANGTAPTDAGQGAWRGPRQGPWRGLGRRLLRLFRPLLLPLLHRMEWRIRTAVDKSTFATGTPARLDELRARTHVLEDRLHARADGMAHTVAVDGAETRRLLVETVAATREGAVDLATQATAEAAAYQAVLVGQLAEATRMLASLARQHETTERRLATLIEQSGHVVRQNDHNQLVLETMRAETGRHDRDAARRLDILLQRGVVSLGSTEGGSGRGTHATGDHLVRTPAGWLVVPGGDERLLMAMVEGGGVLERGTTAVLTALLRPGDTMIDVGAHIGTMTLPAARAVGPGGRVIAVEPGPAALAALRRSLHVNSLAERVVLHGCAAGAADGEAVLHLAPVLGENSLVRGEAGDAAGEGAGVTVAVRPLDALVPAAAGRGPVRLVKIDAEGFELEVWKGMRRLLSETLDLAVIVEFGPSHLARAGIAETAWFDALTAPGFAVWEIDEASGDLRPLRPPAARAALFSANLLLLRRPPEAYPGLRVAADEGGPG